MPQTSPHRQQLLDAQARRDAQAHAAYRNATEGSQNDWHYTYARYRKAGLSPSYAKRKADARLVPQHNAT